MSKPLSALDLGYRFSDAKLLEAALTHRSVGSANNERLEFLGDGILNFIVAAELYRRFPGASEGELSRLRANLVNGETLAQLARTLDLGDYLSLGQGELRSEGYRRESILANAMEAVIGAIYLDGGFDACYRFVPSLYRHRLEAMPATAEMKDPKTRLQEYLHANRKPPPQYTVLEVKGQAHAQVFRVECQADAGHAAEGEGSSRRRAEQDAASKVLRLIENG